MTVFTNSACARSRLLHRPFCAQCIAVFQNAAAFGCVRTGVVTSLLIAHVTASRTPV